MKIRVAAIAALSAAVLLEGCVSTPYGPTVPAMPGKSKSWQQFQAEDADCQDYAYDKVAGRAKEANDHTVATAIIGTALGAGLGAAIGGGRGAAIGAASGAIIGSSYGARDARYSQGSLQGRYNVAYAQCMSAHGNSVEGWGGPPPDYYRHRDYGPPPGPYDGPPPGPYDGPPPPPPPPPGY